MTSPGMIFNPVTGKFNAVPAKFNVLSYNTNYTPTGGEATGDMYWDEDNRTYSAVLKNGVIGQLFKESFIDGQNDTGVTITNGTPVAYQGSIGISGNFRIKLAQASASEAAFYNVGIVTEDIENGNVGKITTLGKVRGIQTDGANYGESWSAGDIIYISGDTAGYLTKVAPQAPIPAIPVALVISAHATNGTLEVRPTFPEKLTGLSDVNGTPLTTTGQILVWDNDNSYFDFTSNISDFSPGVLSNFWNGTFEESFNALVTSDGVTVTMSLEKSGGGDLTMQFSDGETTLDCTPAQTITLTPGTNSVPLTNYVYIPQSTKVLTLSTTGFPTNFEHIKVGFFYLPSATYIQSSGAYINQNWNDHLSGTDNQGHLTHITERMRYSAAEYFSGLDAAGTDQDTNSSYFDYVSGSESYFKCSSGVAYQMHRQAIPAKDTRTDDIHVVNDNTTPFVEIHTLNSITSDAMGNSLSNKFFNIVVWLVANKSGEYSPVMVNLPNGSYSNVSDAEGDINGYDVLTIPSEFRHNSSTGLLLCRMTLKYSSGTNVLEHKSTVDFRGQTPSSATGGTIGNQVTFSDGVFSIFDDVDSTKRFKFQASGITTATTRTYTVPNADGTLALTSDLSAYVPYTGASTPVDLGTQSLTTTGLGIFGNLNVDTLNLNGNAITDSTGTINFDNENLKTTGNLKLGGTSSQEGILDIEQNGFSTSPLTAEAAGFTLIPTGSNPKYRIHYSYAPGSIQFNGNMERQVNGYYEQDDTSKGSSAIFQSFYNANAFIGFLTNQPSASQFIPGYSVIIQDHSTLGKRIRLRDKVLIEFDNTKLVFGGGEDCEVYYDSSNLIIDPDVVGSGIVLIGATGDDDMKLNNIEIDGALNHDGTTIGFFGVTPVTRATEMTDELTTITHTTPVTPDYAIQDLTNSGGFGFVTKDEGNTVLSVIANLQTRVNELETKLTAYGLLQDAD